MTCLRVIVQWKDGLHLRRAVSLVQVAKRFRSTVQLRCGGRVADLRSILSVVALCATLGVGVDVEATGDDEKDAVQAIEQVFRSDPGETAAISADRRES